MASYKLNFGLLRFPGVDELSEALEGFGIPEDASVGVLAYERQDKLVLATVCRRKAKKIRSMDRKKRRLREGEVNSYDEVPLRLEDGKNPMIRTYAGSGASLKAASEILEEISGKPAEIEPLTVDLVGNIITLSKAVECFTLGQVKLSEHWMDSQTGGPYLPKFLSTEHGLELVDGEDSFRKAVVEAAVSWRYGKRKVKVKLCGTASFAFSCKDEDREAVVKLLESIALAPGTVCPRDAGPLFPGSGATTAPTSPPAKDEKKPAPKKK